MIPEKTIIAEKISKKFKIGFKKQQSALANLIDTFSGKEPKKIINALTDVSFGLKKGEILGIIGSNGSGKSTLLRILAGIYPIYDGNLKINGKAIPIISLGQGMHMRLTMRDNIYLVGSFFGLSNKEIKRKFKSIVEFAELENFVQTKLYQFSEGMRQRLAFSISIHCNPDILLLDEVFAVGDEKFRKRSAEKIKELVKNGASVILVSHELWMVEKYCDRVLLMEKGKIIKEGKSKKIVKEYQEIRK